MLGVVGLPPAVTALVVAVVMPMAVLARLRRRACIGDGDHERKPCRGGDDRCPAAERQAREDLPDKFHGSWIGPPWIRR